jgi:hypothetical protein
MATQVAERSALNTNRFDKEVGKSRETSVWLCVGLLVSLAGMATGAALLIWHLAKLIFK